MLVEEAHEKCQPCLYTGLTRGQATTLCQFRTGSAFTKSWPHKRRAVNDGDCQYCGERETIHHIVLICSEYAEAEESGSMILKEVNFNSAFAHASCHLVQGDKYQKPAIAFWISFEKLLFSIECDF